MNRVDAAELALLFVLAVVAARLVFNLGFIAALAALVVLRADVAAALDSAALTLVLEIGIATVPLSGTLKLKLPDRNVGVFGFRNAVEPFRLASTLMLGRLNCCMFPLELTVNPNRAGMLMRAIGPIDGV